MQPTGIAERLPLSPSPAHQSGRKGCSCCCRRKRPTLLDLAWTRSVGQAASRCLPPAQSCVPSERTWALSTARWVPSETLRTCPRTGSVHPSQWALAPALTLSPASPAQGDRPDSPSGSQDPRTPYLPLQPPSSSLRLEPQPCCLPSLSQQPPWALPTAHPCLLPYWVGGRYPATPQTSGRKVEVASLKSTFLTNFFSPKHLFVVFKEISENVKRKERKKKNNVNQETFFLPVSNYEEVFAYIFNQFLVLKRTQCSTHP